MVPFRGKMLRLVEQLAPTLPGPARDVVKAALGLAKPEDAAVKPLAGWQSCMGRPGKLPDLSALLGGRGPLGRPSAPTQQPGHDADAFVTRSLPTPVGPLSFMLFRPTRPVSPPAMIVMLHGCSQDARDFAAGTAMNALAEREGLFVLYPEQSRGANMSRCWNWFLPQHQGREGGEAAAIAAVTRAVMDEHGVKPGRVFVAGLSAGGAMAAIMAETYPELFGGVGIHSGLPFGAAHDMSTAFSAMRQGGVIAPDAAGALAKGVPTIVFHGDADSTVDPRNATAIVSRITARESGLTPSSQNGQAPGGRRYSMTTGRDAGGRVRFESWTVKGAGHAWSGGSAAGSYTDPSGPDASAAMIRFFLGQIGAAERPVAA